MTSEHRNELRRGTYSASQVPGMVIIRACGMTPTPGFKVWLEPLPVMIYPPIHALYFQAPQGPREDVLAPFCVVATFDAAERVDAVTVVDADGSHTLCVEQVPDRAAVGDERPQDDELAYDLHSVEILEVVGMIVARGRARSAPSVGRLVPLPSVGGIAAFELRATIGSLPALTEISGGHALPADARYVEIHSEQTILRIPVGGLGPSTAPRTSAVQDDGLSGRIWNLKHFAFSDSFEEVLAGTRINATFRGSLAGGTVSGSGGCNIYSAAYQIKLPSNLGISDILHTKMFAAEPPGIMEQEARFFAALSRATHIRWTEDELELAGGVDTLVFELAKDWK